MAQPDEAARGARRSAQSSPQARRQVDPHTGDVDRFGLTQAMSTLGRSLQTVHGDVEATLQAITTAAVATVPGAQHAGITLVTADGALESRAGTGPLPQKLDALQAETEQGPCLQSLWEAETVRVEDLTTETRWPAFSPRAAELGAGSMLCFQLFVHHRTMGALNLSASGPGAFGEESESVGLMFATHAAIALVGALQQEQLRDGLRSREEIGRAVGVLVERFGLDPDAALGLLKRVSQDSNTKLRDVARELVRTGRYGDLIPGREQRPPR